MGAWQGFYSTAQVSRLAGVPKRTLYHWKARGIITAGAWRSLGIPVLLTLLVALAALACNYPEPTQPHPLQNPLQHHSKRSTSRA